MDCPRAILHLGVIQEWVGKGELPKERTQSKVAEALRCPGKSEDKAEAMGLAVLWYRRDGTSVESLRESVGRKRGRGGEECRGKLQVPKQGGRAEAKELHKIGIDGLLIKIAESEGFQVEARVLDQETK
ncbi:hypothetical protein BHM03_00002974 [Ensete ventricosum]|nr:hypothetical protein BHM03_00002974 [Ensete ventricosum]